MPWRPLQLVLGILLVSALLARTLWLDSLPGINGDEPYYGIRAFGLFHGQSFSWSHSAGARPVVNPLFWGVELVMAALNSHQFLSLRLPTCVAGILTFVLVGWRWRSWLGPAHALMLALLLAWSPVEIMFSRFGWDPSLMSFCTVLLLTAALAGSTPGLVLAAVYGLVVHPFFACSLPPGVLLWLCARQPGWVPGLLGLCWLGAGLGLVYGWLLRGHDLLRFWSGIVDLLSGEGTFAYLVDPAAHLATPLACAAGLVLLAGLAVGSALDYRRGDLRLAALGAATLFSLCWWYALVGKHAVVPPQERNSLQFIVPLLTWLVAQSRKLQWRTSLTWTLVIALGLIMQWRIWTRYLIPLRTVGSMSHRAFACAHRDLKELAFLQARQWLGLNAPILAEDFWIFTPVLYLAQPYRLPVLHYKDVPQLKEALQAGSVVIANWGSPLYHELQGLDLPLRRATLSQSGGMPVLEVFALDPRPARSSVR